MRQYKKNTGFTLLETLITTFIFSFAMLSLALMQINGMKHGQSANLQSIANMQAMDILERMRANRAGAINEDYNLAKSSEPTSTGVPLEELTTWRENLKSLLPEATSSIDCEATGLCTIDIFWKTIHPNPDSPLEPDELNFQLVSQL